ncbi:MAG: hypothetical protein Q4P66_05185 [Actinomycetaceae bacterium]|nr:hypothetical protein [Actinomycetaceae bacterium]MDO5747036.1 hypothetical protein [Actinomycetaceae bacterium]
MHIITHGDITGLNILPQQCLQWVNEVLKHKDQYLLPPKISIPFKTDGFYNVMPAILTPFGYAGVKLVNRYPQRSPSLDSKILLYELDDGLPVALLDANWITTARTGAVASHAISHLAVPDFSVIAVAGLGNTAVAAVDMLQPVIGSRPVTFKLLHYKDHGQRFQERFAHVSNYSFSMCTTAEEAFQDSDVIISAVTYKENDWCPPSTYRQGSTVVPIHTRGFMECDRVFDKVFVDDIGHVKHFRYYNEFASCHEMADIVQEKCTGRDNNNQRILAYNIGIAAHDIYYAAQIFELLKSKSSNVNVTGPTGNYWF